MTMTNSLKIFSMFDGVGGFIIGLNHANRHFDIPLFQTTYSNQYEPSRKSQDAFEVGLLQFPEINHLPEDIQTIDSAEFDEMKNNGVNMIVGGFPCQDYSVARSKKFEKGIEGKKGVLFWEIIRAVKHIQPDYLILENVDRLLKSPSTQRGRDFAIMLGAFNQLNYSVEWRVINAADYGRAQRRRRIYFFVYKNSSEAAVNFDKVIKSDSDLFENGELNFDNYIFKSGLFARQFPIEQVPNKKRVYSQKLSDLANSDNDYILDISDHFTGTIWNTGIMRYGKYYTIDTTPIFEKPTTLGEIVSQAKTYYADNFGEAEYKKYISNYYISDEEKIKKFEYLRGSKKIERKTPDGHTWIYSEGGMSPYDSLDLPARTMLTSESSVNRSTHLLKINNKYRLLAPIEAELLQDFPPDWTKYKLTVDGKKEVSDKMRYFFMGNALVTGIVERIGIELGKIVHAKQNINYTVDSLDEQYVADE
jgi:DNA (cytosine-5)-methyltransferase 1